jgi:eukaryotic-like serine/threonine-protein kinase
MALSAKEVFQDALDIPPAERAAWVRARCGNDEALWEKVEALLAAHADATRLDRGPAAGFSAFVDLKPQKSAPLEDIGTIIDDKYELLSVLGEGGFGIVYRARQTAPVVRDVALKILRVGLDSHQIVARFQVEQQTLALMDHPGIARVYDAGETAHGRPYIAMEFVDGDPITRFCERNSLGLDARLRLIEQVCMAIQHAHTKGIIHRDLKPTNILVTMLDGEPFPTVIDFGIAKAIDPDASAIVLGEGAALTQEFQIIGTPQYMSPEQATRGSSAGGVDTRSDVYSIGTVLYELIAGVPPFDSGELRQAGLDGVLRVIRERTPARPSTRLLSGEQTQATIATATRTFGEAPARLSRRVAGDIDWIVMRSLEKEPARRYQSAADLAADIRRHLAHEPVLAGPPSRLYQARKFVRRHRVAVAAAAIVAISLAATSAISLEAARRARAAERTAVENADRATKAEAIASANEKKAQKELKKAVAVVDFTQRLLKGVAPAVARGRDTTLLRELIDQVAATPPRTIEEEGVLDLVVRHLIANVMYELGEMGKAYNVLRPAWDATANLTDRQDRIDRLSAGSTVGELLGEMGRVDEAATFLRQLLAEYESLGVGQSDKAINTLASLSANCLQRGEAAEARTLAERALDIALNAVPFDAYDAHLARDRLANALSELGDTEGAIKVWEDNLADILGREGEDAPQVISIRASLGASYREVGRLAEAETSLREAAERARKLYEPGNPILLQTLSVYGDFFQGVDRFEESLKVLEEAHASATLKLSADNLTVVTIDARLARALAGVKRYDEAIAIDVDVMSRLLKQSPVDESQIALVAWDIAKSQIAGGRPREALESITRYRPREGWSEQVPPFYKAVLELATGRANLAAGKVDLARASAARTRELFAEEGRTKGRYFRQLELLEADIATAATQPAAVTMPSSNPSTMPAAQ